MQGSGCDGMAWGMSMMSGPQMSLKPPRDLKPPFHLGGGSAKLQPIPESLWAELPFEIWEAVNQAGGPARPSPLLGSVASLSLLIGARTAAGGWLSARLVPRRGGLLLHAVLLAACLHASS